MANSTIFQIPSMPGDVDKNTIVARMKANQPLTPQEMSFAAGIFDGNMSQITAAHDTPGVQDTLTTFDRLFVNGVSVRSLCEQNQRTDGMNPQEKTNYMKAFLFTSALARENVIEYCPPGKENSDEPAPQVRIDTRISQRDLEQERPKKGFWRTIGEALRIIKPIPSIQEAYEERMQRDEAAGNDQERGALIKHAVEIRAGSIQAEASINRSQNRNQNRERTNVTEIQREEKGPEQKAQKITEPKPVELTPVEREITERKLQDMQDTKTLFTAYFHVGRGSGHEHNTNQAEPIDLTKQYEKLEINSELKQGTKQSTGWGGKIPNDNMAAVAEVMTKIHFGWTDAPKDEKHPEGKALMLTGIQSNGIMRGIDQEILDLNKKLNPPEKAVPVPGKQ